ncbi:hypothetical protein WMY93_023066 [Mugilogobius chulae]|uniref:Uncharacterized protein n=1 Tax=Mugilogobius chulae TaxID=88201 RepID=A0AAW0N3A2_9GOBI
MIRGRGRGRRGVPPSLPPRVVVSGRESHCCIQESRSGLCGERERERELRPSLTEEGEDPEAWYRPKGGAQPPSPLPPPPWACPVLPACLPLCQLNTQAYLKVENDVGRCQVWHSPDSARWSVRVSGRDRRQEQETGAGDKGRRQGQETATGDRRDSNRRQERQSRRQETAGDRSRRQEQETVTADLSHITDPLPHVRSSSVTFAQESG